MPEKLSLVTCVFLWFLRICIMSIKCNSWAKTMALHYQLTLLSHLTLSWVRNSIPLLVLIIEVTRSGRFRLKSWLGELSKVGLRLILNLILTSLFLQLHRVYVKNKLDNSGKVFNIVRRQSKPPSVSPILIISVTAVPQGSSGHTCQYLIQPVASLTDLPNVFLRHNCFRCLQK